MEGGQSEEGTDSHYRDRSVARRYDRAFGGGKPTAAQYERFDRFVRLLPPGGLVLDAGCGTGRFEPAFLECGLRVIGIDSSQAMLDRAKELIPHCDFIKMDIRGLEFADGTFDGVWNVAVVLHLDDVGLSGCLSEARRVLKPSGVLHVATRTAQSDRTVAEESTEGGRMVVHYYSRGTLVDALERAGFGLVDELRMPDDLGRPFDYIYLYARVVAETPHPKPP